MPRRKTRRRGGVSLRDNTPPSASPRVLAELREAAAKLEEFTPVLESAVAEGRPTRAFVDQLYEHADSLLIPARRIRDAAETATGGDPNVVAESDRIRRETYRISVLLAELNNLPTTGGRRLKGGENAMFHNWSTDVNKHSAEIEAMLPTLSQLRSTAGVGSDVQAQLRNQLDPHLEKLRELLDSAPTDDRRTRTVATRARTALTRGEEGMRILGAARKRRKTRRKRSRLN